MTGLALQHWYERMQISPWFGYQLANNKIPISSQCNALVTEYGWQNADRAGRADIRAAIENAEQLVRRYVGFYPSPRYVNEGVSLWHASYLGSLGDWWERVPSWYQNDYYNCQRWFALTLPDAEVRALGAPAETTAKEMTLTYTDDDGDTIKETATAVATVPAGTQADEVVVRFRAVDCGAISPPEVTPRSVSIDGTEATVVLDSYTLVRPIRYQSPTLTGTTALDPNDSAVFATAVEVFRRYPESGTTADTAAATVVYSDDTEEVVEVRVKDARTGLVLVGAGWVNWACRPKPSYVRMRYLAGVPRSGLRMRGDWETTVARLAAAELARPICACAGANKEIYEWQTDLSRVGSGTDVFSQPGDMTNPLGARRGHIYTWRQIERLQSTRGIVAG